MDARMGSNINGPSLISAPDWISQPLGRYYLYFAVHVGRYSRLAVADDLLGPWRIHSPGVLSLQQSYFHNHIASPDVHVVTERHQIWMYFYGQLESGGQATRVAVSKDGLRFEVLPDLLGPAYFRVFRWAGVHYSLAMPGAMHRSPDGLSAFARGPSLFSAAMRHSAVFIDKDMLTVIYSNVGDTPEQLLLPRIQLNPDWRTWESSVPKVLLSPQKRYEGGDLPVAPSERGMSNSCVRQLRDPAVFEEKGRRFLVFSVAGERGLALAELIDQPT
jgi:hypothetical protein